MTLKVWPNEYDKRDHITKGERAILRFAESKFDDGYIVTGIDPVGLSTETSKMGFYLSPKKGLITYSLVTDPFKENKASSFKKFIELAETIIYNRLLDSKILIVRNGSNKILKFPYKHIFVFTTDKSITVNDELFKQLNGYITAALFTPLNSKPRNELNLFTNFRQGYDKNYSEISESEVRAVFERLAPEYTIVLHEKDPVEIKQTTIPQTMGNMTITGKEVEYKTFLLDDYQVNLVNEMGTGHRVILANPGAGKSVLLLSKAFKYASMNKKINVLLTCYNKNLSDLYDFKRNCADFGDNQNLYIFTFHKLVAKIFNEIWHESLSGPFPTDEDIKKCINYIRNGRGIPIKFGAIFIDEVQIFDPLYLELCYLLLDGKPDNLFLMAGDLNQTVRSQSRRGDAPWKKINGVHLDFSGRVKYIEKNYRNSKLIGHYLNGMLSYMNSRMNEYQMINLKEYEYDSFDVCDTQSIALEIKTGINRYTIQKEIINAVNEITSKYDVNYSDIAILFPYKKCFQLRYFLMDWIMDALNEAGIPYSQITPSTNNKFEKIRYSETNGIVLSTIDSSLGLDFKAVILTGLYPYNYVYSDNRTKTEIASWEDIGKLNISEKEKIQIHMRKIYTAASRARDILYILSDMKMGSPLEDILLDRSK